MNKRLILVRHANANSGMYSDSDFDRTLSNTGINEAQEIGFRLKNKALAPAHLISSPATRALSTAKVFAGIWGMDSEEIVRENSIYESTVEVLLRLVNDLNEELEFVGIFGHNPEMTAFAEYLTGAGLYEMPTCGIVVIDFPFDSWKLASKDSGTMLLFDYPGADTTL